LLHFACFITPIVDFDVVAAISNCADSCRPALRAPSHRCSTEDACLGTRLKEVSLGAGETVCGGFGVAVVARSAASLTGEAFPAAEVEVFVASRARRGAVARSVSHARASDQIKAEVATRALILRLRGAGVSDSWVAPIRVQVIVIGTVRADSRRTAAQTGKRARHACTAVREEARATAA
jgi:hypothetical protein